MPRLTKFTPLHLNDPIISHNIKFYIARSGWTNRLDQTWTSPKSDSKIRLKYGQNTAKIRNDKQQAVNRQSLSQDG
jgi:hypothetical protein